MIQLITVVGRSARNLYLKEQYISDFKSLMRTVTSKRMTIISTRFRSDLFCCAENSEYNSILKLWAFYTNTNLSSLDSDDLSISIGDEKSLCRYFQAINKLSSNWHYYRLYKRAFHYTINNDVQNPVAKTIVQCDQYLTGHPGIIRKPLINCPTKEGSKVMTDTFSLAMRIMNNKTHCN